MIQAIRGMNDILPEESVKWQAVEKVLKETAQQYGYQEIRYPIVEKTELFKRTIGEVTDIVEKEMYTFEDNNGDSLTLRPEGTAGCVRAGLEHGLFHNQIQRLWYMGPMFRHERPQKGRYRQFYQFGAEAFGLSGPDVDVELILMTANMWKRLGFYKHVTLQLNSLGTAETRKVYRKKLVEYFSAHKEQLDEDSVRRLETNPMRILDSKNPEMKTVIAKAPSLLDSLDEESKQHFDQLCNLLKASNIKYEINPRLVRGLDYYTHTVFEWVTDQLGAQGTICAGGRFNDLVELLDGRPTPAVGFALGIERLMELLDAVNVDVQHDTDPHIYFVLAGDAAEKMGIQIAEQLREEIPVLRILMNCGGGSIKSQFKRADKSGAQLAVILGDEELSKNQFTVKYLREEKEQGTVSFEELEQIVVRIV